MEDYNNQLKKLIRTNMNIYDNGTSLERNYLEVETNKLLEMKSNLLKSIKKSGYYIPGLYDTSKEIIIEIENELISRN